MKTLEEIGLGIPGASSRGAPVTPVDFDFAVAGSGAAGAATAARLAAGGARTLLLEQGTTARPQADGRAALSLYYANSGLTAAFGNGLYPVAVGRTLGGTTTINSGTCLRTPREMLLRWRLRAPGFDPDAFQGRLEEAWTAVKAKPVPERLLGQSARLFFRGLGRLGLPPASALDRAEDRCRGDGRCCFVCPSDAKVTAKSAFLDPMARDARLTVWPGARLTRVTPGRPPSLEVSREGGRRLRLRARAVVLSCGALATPYFLRGLGLRAGRDLTIHPASKVFALFDEPVRGWQGVPQSAGWLDEREPRLRFEGAFVPPEVAPLTMPLEGRRLRWWLDRYDNVASFGFMARDLSRGRVGYPLGPSLPLLRYDLEPDDARLLARGMRRVASVYFAAGARRVLLPLNRPDNELESAGALEDFPWDSVRPWQIQLMGFHPLGTCGLGRALGADLKAADGLYVCDGSVIPESLGVNPQITIYAFALDLAARLLEGGRAR